MRGRVALVLALLLVTGLLEGREVARQQRRGARPSHDRHPASHRLLTWTTWPTGLAGIAAALLAPGLALPGAARRAALWAGVATTVAGVGLRQWAIRTLGRFFVGYVSIQPGHRVVRDGPYRWVRHPSYAGLWLQFAGIGLATGSGLGLGICLAVPLVGIVSRIEAEEATLAAELPDKYPAYAASTRRMVPFVW